jgi:hypothetical protein
VLRARGAELEREFPFGVVRQLFEGVLLAASDEDRASLLAGAAGLAAGVLGLTNPARGQHLFVTARTVEGHLTHVFQKLDIKTRRWRWARQAASSRRHRPRSSWLGWR